MELSLFPLMITSATGRQDLLAALITTDTPSGVSDLGALLVNATPSRHLVQSEAHGKHLVSVERLYDDHNPEN